MAVVSALFLPASSALIKERVPAGRLRRFNARYEMGTRRGMLLSATVGGLSVQTFGAVPLRVLNAGTFMVSALCAAAMRRRPDRAPAATAPREQAPVPAAPRGPLRVRRSILLYAQKRGRHDLQRAAPTAVIGELHLGAAAFGAEDTLGCLGFLAATGAYRIVSRRHPDVRIARSRSGGGSAAVGVSCAAASTSPSPRSAAAPGSPARNSDSASSACSLVCRVR
ncbi:MFS transporter [Streptomyces nigrescens]|uniref:MFS transporter n=1 Tax=Streptomyces nigrescens TaxID=1920 RepID=UPI00346A327B